MMEKGHEIHHDEKKILSSLGRKDLRSATNENRHEIYYDEKKI